MSIKILLWNVAMTPNPPPRISTRRAKERAPGIASLIRDYDVIVLNESFLYQNFLLSLLLEYKAYTDPRPWYKIFNSGVMILSKVPIENFTYMHYRQGSNWDWFVAKGLLQVSFSFEGERYHLYGTHLQAGNRPCDHRARSRQADEIGARIRAQRADSDTVILCGDFNCGPVYDRNFERYSGHYSSADDARQRNVQYTKLLSLGGDLESRTRPILTDPTEDDISSFILRARDDVRASIRRIPVASELSDTGPLAIQINPQVA